MKTFSKKLKSIISVICIAVLLFAPLIELLTNFQNAQNINLPDEDGICFFHNIINPSENYEQVFEMVLHKYKNIILDKANHPTIRVEFANTIKEIAVPLHNQFVKDFPQVVCFVNSNEKSLVPHQHFKIFHPPQSFRLPKV